MATSIIMIAFFLTIPISRMMPIIAITENGVSKISSASVAPIATIAGPNTGLVNPWGVLVDANGLIYVDTNAGGGNDSIVVFAAGANGNVAPLRTIVGSNTGLNSPLDMVLAP